MPRTRPTLLVLVGMAFFAVACGGSDGGAASGDTGATVVTSDDGRATLEIPAGIGVDGVTIAASSAAVPTELSDLDGTVVVYDLEPSGLTFAQPATLTLRLDAAELGVATGVPLAGAVLTDDSGGTEALPTVTRRVDDTIIVTAELSHFSVVSTFVGGLVFDMTPSEVTASVGDRFESRLTVTDRTTDLLPHGSELAGTAAKNPVRDLGIFYRPTFITGRYDCIAASDGPVPEAFGFIVGVPLEEVPDLGISQFAKLFGLSPGHSPEWLTGLSGTATCLGSDDDDPGSDTGDEPGDGISDGPDDQGADDATTSNGSSIPPDCEGPVTETVALPDPLDATVEIEVREATPTYAAELAEPHEVSAQPTPGGAELSILGPGSGIGLRLEIGVSSQGVVAEGRGYNTLSGGNEIKIIQEIDEIGFGDSLVSLTGQATEGDGSTNPFDLDVVFVDDAGQRIFDWFVGRAERPPVSDEVALDLYVLDLGDSISAEAIDGTPCTEFEVFVFVEGVGPQRAFAVTDASGAFRVDGFDRPSGTIKLKSIGAFAIHDGKQVASAFGDKVSPNE